MQSSKNLKTKINQPFIFEKSFSPKTMQVKSSRNLNSSLGSNETNSFKIAADSKPYGKYDFSKFDRAK